MQRIIEKAGPFIYVIFFTYVGISINLEVLIYSWAIALLLFAIRIIAIMAASFIGSILGKESRKFVLMSWTPYITQAGVSLGLITVVAGHFAGWSSEFGTIMIAVIVINQFVGPPLMKWAINRVGESHTKAKVHEFDGTRDAFIFGVESQSVTLAKNLQKHNWEVRLITMQEDILPEDCNVIDIVKINEFTFKSLNKLGMEHVEAIVLMKTDEENLKICELAFEHFGVPNIIVRLNNRSYFDRFHELGALIVEPKTAILSLLDHFVRSPHATSLLLGMEEGHDSMDIEVLNEDIHGMAIRNIRLPLDVLVLSIDRHGHILTTHGYTRLRKHDIVTVVGLEENLEKVRLFLQ